MWEDIQAETYLSRGQREEEMEWEAVRDTTA
jgi:hypothetical protein